MTNHMQNKSSFTETHQIFYSSCSERSFWIHTVNVAKSVGREEIVVSFGISHLKVVEMSRELVSIGTSRVFTPYEVDSSLFSHSKVV